MAEVRASPTVVLEGDFTVNTVPSWVATSRTLAEDLSRSAVGQDAFKLAMRLLPSGVAMVTTRVDGRAWGLTVSSCCSLSVEPPQLLVSLGRFTTSCREILRTGRFGVSVLGSPHKVVAERGSAAGVAKFVDEFCEGGGAGSLDTPIVAGALCHLECVLVETHPVSDHEVIVGLVTRVVTPASGENGEPLIFFDRRFWTLGRDLTSAEEEQATTRRARVAGSREKEV